MTRSPLFVLSAVALALTAAACNDNRLEAGAEPTDVVTETPAPTATPTAAPEQGAIAGRVCGPAGNVWLSNAHVSVVQDNASIDDTYTDPNGNFLLNNVDPGNRTLTIVSGSFNTSQAVTVTGGQTTTLPTPACVNSAHVAVVTGDWDSIQNVLGAVGITDVTLYDGVGSTAPTINTLLTNASLMSTYDIIFLNCGDYIDRQPGLFSNATVVANLQAYVTGGGSLYASDWAYDFVEVAFPAALDFYGNDSTRGAAADGVAGGMSGSVMDANLSAALGHSSVSLSYNLDIWAVIKTAGAGTKVLVQGNATAYDSIGFPDVSVNNSPLAVQFPVGTNGGSVLYTTFHNESQTTADMDKILSYMVFQL